MPTTDRTTGSLEMNDQSADRATRLRITSIAALYMNVIMIACAQTATKEYIPLNGRPFAIETIGVPAGQIIGYKINPYGMLFRAPGATITIDGAMQFGPGVPIFNQTVAAGSHVLQSSGTPSGYTTSYSICSGCTTLPAFTAGTSASANVPANGNVDTYWMYQSNVTPSGNFTYPAGAATVAGSGSYDAFANGVLNTDGVLFATYDLRGGNSDLQWYPGTEESAGRWKGTALLANHSSFTFLYVDVYLFGTKPGGGTYLGSPYVYRYLSTVAPTNAGFETTGLASWTVYPPDTTQVVASASAVRTGTLGVSANSGAVGAYQDVEGLLPGNTYVIKAWVRSSGATGPKAHMLLHDATYLNETGSGEVLTSSTWQQVAVSFTATLSSMVRIHLHREAGGTGSVYWDDVTVTNVSLANPGFESGGGSWNTYNGVSGGVSTAARLTGTSSYAITSGLGGIYQDITGATPNKLYRFEGWAKSSNPAAGAATQILAENQNGSPIVGSAVGTLSTIDWQRFCVPITAASNGLLRVYLARINNPAATIYWDDIVLREGACPN